MFNLVILEDNWDYYFSVFDQRGNEIWHDKGDLRYLTGKLLDNKFPIKYVLHKDLFSLESIDYLDDVGLLRKCEKIVGFDLVKLSEPIANESKSGFGLARLLHRNFVSSVK